MINLLIALALGGATFGGLAVPFGWIAAIFPGVVVTLVAYFLLARRTSNQLEAAMPEVQKAIMAQRFDQAIEKLEALRPLAKWQFLIGGALDSQIGMILYAYKQQYDQARPYLESSFIRQWQAKAMLAALHYKKKRYDEMREVFEKATATNKKIGLLWSAWAWCEWKQGNKDKAMEVLAEGIKAIPDDERLKTNLLALQNGKKLKMKSYAEEWWALMLERPPVQRMQSPMGGRAPRGKMKRR